MALSDPISITTSDGAKTLNGVSFVANGKTYRSADGYTTLTVSHNYGNNRNQHRSRLDVAIVAANPFDSSVNAIYSMSTSFFSDIGAKVPGFTVAQQVTNIAAHFGLYTHLPMRTLLNCKVARASLAEAESIMTL